MDPAFQVSFLPNTFAPLIPLPRIWTAWPSCALRLKNTSGLRMPDSRPTRCEACDNDFGGLFRCRTCLWPRIVCCKCLLTAHREQPLHRIEWFFLGHGGDKCPKGVRDGNFTILALNGAHDVTMDFCGCENSAPRGTQLEAMRLYGSAHTVLDFELPERSGRRKEGKGKGEGIAKGVVLNTFEYLREAFGDPFGSELGGTSGRSEPRASRPNSVAIAAMMAGVSLLPATIVVQGGGGCLSLLLGAGGLRCGHVVVADVTTTASKLTTAAHVPLTGDVVGVEDNFIPGDADHIEVLVPLSALKIARSWYSGGRLWKTWWFEERVYRVLVDDRPCHPVHDGPKKTRRAAAHPSWAGWAENTASSPSSRLAASPTNGQEAVGGTENPIQCRWNPFAPTVDDFVPDDEAPIYDMLPKEPRALRPSVCDLSRITRSASGSGRKSPKPTWTELIQLEGRGEYQVDERCIICGAAAGDYRCRECFTDDLYCKACIVAGHQDTPLHGVEMWKDGRFERTTLKTLGLRIQLGHGKPNNARPRQGRCANPHRAVDDDFVIIDVHRIHEVAVDFCGCETAQPHDIQLLRARWYPCTGKHPRTASTFRVLKRFCLMPLESHCAAKEFYMSIVRESDNTGRCLSEFLYALFLALDANFRMRRKKVSSEEKDPSLGDGWSFYCEIAPYYSYLAANWKQKQERSTCVAHDAVDKPDRESRGTASSGIATVDCARHNMKRPNSVGDLQLGERYINMDYIFFIGLAGSKISELFVSYDIACQWHKNIWERMKTFDHEVRFRAQSWRSWRRRCVAWGAGATLEEWRVEIEAWEGDASNPNPFARKGERRTVVDVRRQMAEEVQKDMEQAMDVDGAKDSSEEGDDEGASAEMHATEWIGMGLQLEELQRTLGFDVGKIGNHPTAEQQTNLTEQGNKTSAKAVDVDGCAGPNHPPRRCLASGGGPRAEEDFRDAGAAGINGRVPCDTELYDYEFRLREAQAHEALDDVRHQLLLRTHLYKYKDRFARGVKANSRSQTKIEGVEERTRRSAERAGETAEAKRMGDGVAASDAGGRERDAAGVIPGPGTKEAVDEEGIGGATEGAAAGAEAKARMSWIWRSPGLEEEEGEMNEALRIEWAKTRARFLRQSEQLDLLEEEMRRILQFLWWRAGWWDERAGRRPQGPEEDVDRVPGVAYAPKHPSYAEGNVAYARRQAEILRTRAAQFEEMWVDAADFIDMGRTAVGQDDNVAEGADEDADGVDEDDMVLDGEAGDEQPIPPRPVPQPLSFVEGVADQG
ncbi:hypothetical protein C8F04DRAFT_1191646 [Mycena alexandri]|uniref:CxC2-like cysteine cluster KDZ transposase-associated domain-containing protein n=1 Tax=Mycena alexandri TaxID=1745969 RepID=A0AAD6WSB9_9AGAR|nr:hypothetical protein C8F04DRAFT_1191646 [Mycena alexandri]